MPAAMRAVLRSVVVIALVVCMASMASMACAQTHSYDITDEQYYEMPRLFHLDDYEACLARRGVYCLGSFDLTADTHHQLYQMMQRYSSNWVDNFNHTRLHRGLCVSWHCPPPVTQPRPNAEEEHAAWFASCVNASTMAAYNLSARLNTLDYCQHSPAGTAQLPLTPSEKAFAGLVAVLLALVAVCTVLDLTLPDHARKGSCWALSWSVRGCWGALHAAPGGGGGGSGAADLRAFDGLRVLCMMFVIIEHVCWITTQTYLADTRRFEQTRHASDAMLMANSTLVVQIFFLMSSFLLAHKLLQQHRQGHHIPFISTFFETMFNRIIRISPTYFVVLWFAASWWERLGRGPMWAPLVSAEAAICRKKWWTHLIYMNNIIDADDKCLIQTWYLAADMQLYAASLALTLALQRVRCGRRGALCVLAALLAAALALLATLAYMWRLAPTFLMHNPESVRSRYRDGPGRSFNVLYQSPLGNAPGALAGLLLAHAHHALADYNINLAHYKVFRWVSVSSVPLAVGWVAASPLLLDTEGGPRAVAAALAALERPIFATFVALALAGAMHGVPSSVGRFLSWGGWSAWARLSFGALLLHMPINKSLVAARLALTQLDRQTAILEWFGVAAVSYMAALPLALLVEIPAQRLHRALQRRCARTAPPPPHTATPAPTHTSRPRALTHKSDL